MADLEFLLAETCSQQQEHNQLFKLILQKIQPIPPYSPGTQQSGYNQQPLYLMYPTQPMAYMQQPPMTYMQQQQPMSYMQQPPYQMPVYRPEMASHDGICPDVPIGAMYDTCASVYSFCFCFLYVVFVMSDLVFVMMDKFLYLI
ncbi:uncharacterized protein LOC126625569 [Malus sylvestris]|uniref:uncharacterized protein LOC126625569 n=1 Tax=Malus sylvestris TaxID=3752 RepID=UPI0021ABCE6D|nr:uncharacterized protein LOC126625569 [Malus sylvestris]